LCCFIKLLLNQHVALNYAPTPHGKITDNNGCHLRMVKKLKTLILISILLTISACGQFIHEIRRKPLYSGPTLGADRVAILLDTNTRISSKVDGWGDMFIYKIDSTIIDSTSDSFRDRIKKEYWDNTTGTALTSIGSAFDLLPGKHIITLKTNTYSKSYSQGCGLLMCQNTKKATIYEDQVLPEIEFNAKPGLVYCPQLETTIEEIKTEKSILINIIKQLISSDTENTLITLKPSVIPCSVGRDIKNMIEKIEYNPR